MNKFVFYLCKNKRSNQLQIINICTNWMHHISKVKFKVLVNQSKFVHKIIFYFEFLWWRIQKSVIIVASSSSAPPENYLGEVIYRLDSKSFAYKKFGSSKLTTGYNYYTLYLFFVRCHFFEFNDRTHAMYAEEKKRTLK